MPCTSVHTHNCMSCFERHSLGMDRSSASAMPFHIAGWHDTILLLRRWEHSLLHPHSQWDDEGPTARFEMLMFWWKHQTKARSATQWAASISTDPALRPRACRQGTGSNGWGPGQLDSSSGHTLELLLNSAFFVSSINGHLLPKLS